MRRLLNDIYYSFPVQLFILHFRKYQVLLIFWVILASAVDSGFMKGFGADALFFVPEYMGNVSALSSGLVGVAMSVFFMSWNITTFILHTKRFKFLAAASKPFLKYCINNAVLPALFLIFYLIRSFQFNLNKELMTVGEHLILIGGFIIGFVLTLAFSFAFFFGADRRILKSMTHVISNKEHFLKNYGPHKNPQQDGFGMRVNYYFSVRFRLLKARNVSHYSENFLDMIFKRHHFAAIKGILFAFIFLIVAGFFLDVKFFQVPAAVSITVFFALMVAVIGALTYFLQSWSVLFVIILFIVLNALYKNEIIDPRNKAYGVNYNNKTERPAYTKEVLQGLCTPDKIAADKTNMIAVMDNWKKKQPSEKPVMIIINVSGGGLRSAAFVMNTLQQLDSATKGALLQKTFLITGASGGMLSATYFRELYLEKKSGKKINLQNTQYLSDISQDLLNPVFSSLISRDIFSPPQKFSVGPYQYIKDRGYAFEQKLNENTSGILNKQIGEYAANEKAGNIPLMIFNSVITRDGRKMMACTQPLSFMMKPAEFEKDATYSPDAVDFTAMFKKQDPQNLRILTALRMNATFPYILPNVWLPSEPVIEVMDAGVRDNFGQETALRFIDNFKEWLTTNTSGVVLLQLRDRLKDNWQYPLETGSVTDVLVKLATMLSANWYKLQDYFQNDQFGYLTHDSTFKVQRLTFMYVPFNEDSRAPLSFHLTNAEKKDVVASFKAVYNQGVLKELLNAIKQD